MYAYASLGETRKRDLNAGDVAGITGSTLSGLRDGRAVRDLQLERRHPARVGADARPVSAAAGRRTVVRRAAARPPRDMDAQGRVRLDAVARFLQDIAIDDVQETGWGMPEHLWFVRRIRLEVREPLLHDRELELVTWCSGVASIAAGRRWSVTGDRGRAGRGRQRLDPPRPRSAAGADRVVRRLCRGRRGPHGLDAARAAVRRGSGTATRWELRSTDVDLHGHVNNAVYWQALEGALGPEAATQLVARARLPRPDRSRRSARAGGRTVGGGPSLGFCVGGITRAVARVGLSAGA